MRRFIPAFFSLFTSVLMTACATNNQGIEIVDSWARPAKSGENSAIYLRITSHGRDDTLLDVHTSLAMTTELHRSVLGEEGIMKMEPLVHLELPANQMIELIPGGMHVMLMRLDSDLHVGDKVTLSLFFEHNREISIDVPVQTP